MGQSSHLPIGLQYAESKKSTGKYQPADLTLRRLVGQCVANPGSNFGLCLKNLLEAWEIFDRLEPKDLQKRLRRLVQKGSSKVLVSAANPHEIPLDQLSQDLVATDTSDRLEFGPDDRLAVSDDR